MTGRTRVLVLGAAGMLGHRVLLAAGARGDDVSVSATTRDPRPERRLPAELRQLVDESGGAVLGAIDITDVASLDRAMELATPDVVVNAAGLVKQRPEARSPAAAIAVNALAPHVIADRCGELGVRLVHVSTDCVFSGDRGRYTEDDRPDATDLYGRSKALGEPSGRGMLTLRTSLIGRSLIGTEGLVEWFLAATAQPRSVVEGWRHATFSGLTTPVLAELIIDLACRCADLDGVFHVAAEPITKLDLLVLLAGAFDRPPAMICPHDEPHLDRSLDGSRLATRIDFQPPSWPTMVGDLAADRRPYEQWRARGC